MSEKIKNLVKYVSSGLSIDEMRDLGLCLLFNAVSLKVKEFEDKK